MKRFKQIDLFINIILITGFTVLTVYKSAYLFMAYFITGGWQVISMLVHAFAGWFTGKNTARRSYHWVSFIIIAMGILGPVVSIFYLIYFIMLFAAPVMAITYSVICYNELRSLQQRPSDIF